jgi:hypothetical protein
VSKARRAKWFSAWAGLIQKLAAPTLSRFCSPSPRVSTFTGAKALVERAADDRCDGEDGADRRRRWRRRRRVEAIRGAIERLLGIDPRLTERPTGMGELAIAERMGEQFGEGDFVILTTPTATKGSAASPLWVRPSIRTALTTPRWRR